MEAHACTSIYSGGRDREVPGSRPAWVKSSGDPISINKTLGASAILATWGDPGGSLSRLPRHKNKTLFEK
jgi:hypothetical protein